LINKVSAEGKIVFVGEGIHDTPVLAHADVGAAMGPLGSDAGVANSTRTIGKRG
jgi:Cd2+/Zn2+-exporting ATPase